MIRVKQKGLKLARSIPLRKLISGGQTGVDRASLDVALSLGIPCGGWCPAGRLAEDGVIADRYPLQETDSKSYSARTRWNVRDSDGTLILSETPFTGGTALTARAARELLKPLCIVHPFQESKRNKQRVLDWIIENGIQVLNIAGPRASTVPAIYDATCRFLRDLLKSAPVRTEATAKGAVRRSAIPASVLRELNLGRRETRTLSEALAIDFSLLVRHIGLNGTFPDAETTLAAAVPYMQRMKLVGIWIAHEFGRHGVHSLRTHASDTVRCWGAFATESLTGLSLASRLKVVRPFANDPHFGVRECAWMAVRNHLALDLPAAVRLLEPWSREPIENIRRFAIEVLRPRGVWCAHLQELKESPQLVRPLLDNVSQDESRYVQNSVANWLNDAAKSQPAWVVDVCAEWQRSSSSKATGYICRRALRSLK